MTSTSQKIAFVHLTSRTRQTAVATLSVVFGVSMYVFMNSFMSGVNSLQNDLAFSTLAHIRVYNDEPAEPRLLFEKRADIGLVHVRNQRKQLLSDGIRNSTETMAVLEHHPSVMAVTPEVNFAGYFQSGAIKIEGSVSGVDAVRADSVFSSTAYMADGSWGALKHRPDGIVIGVTLAKNLGVRINDGVQVVTSEGVTRALRVVGISKYSIESVDARKAFVNIATARQMTARNSDFATDLQIRIEDCSHARQVANGLAPALPYTVEPWPAASEQLEAGSQLRDIIALAVSGALLIVAGFGIYNIMNMTVNERLREIAILNAMGFNSHDIVTIFLLQSVIIGILGGVAGITVGFGISVYVDGLSFPVASIGTYPIAYDPADYVMAAVAGLSTTFIAGFLPAYKASRIDPVAILRGT